MRVLSYINLMIIHSTPSEVLVHLSKTSLAGVRMSTIAKTNLSESTKTDSMKIYWKLLCMTFYKIQQCVAIDLKRQ